MTSVSTLQVECQVLFLKDVQLWVCPHRPDCGGGGVVGRHPLLFPAYLHLLHSRTLFLWEDFSIVLNCALGHELL